MAMVISIIRWVCHDLLLLGSLVSCDESSASLFRGSKLLGWSWRRETDGGPGEAGGACK